MSRSGRTQVGCRGARFGCWLAVVLLALPFFGRAESASLIAPENRVAPDAPAWRDLAADFARRGDVTADFEERRYFPFRHDPVVLHGEVRVSPAHGLSLHYTAPQERTIVVDTAGMITREPEKQAAPPPDARANAAVQPLLEILRFDFARLSRAYDLYGRRDGAAWSLALVPHDATFRRMLGDIFVSGEGDAVRTIELRKSSRQRIEIAIAPPRSTAAFTADELKRYFR